MGSCIISGEIEKNKPTVAMLILSRGVLVNSALEDVESGVLSLIPRFEWDSPWPPISPWCLCAVNDGT